MSKRGRLAQDADPVAAVVERLRAAAKYRAVHPDTIADVVRAESAGGGGAGELERRARARLHKVAALHLLTARPSALRKPPPADSALRDWCREILRGHVSTAERLPDVDDFYPALLALVPQPESIADIACALNVFTLPWLREVTTATYTGYDLNADFVAAGNAFLSQHHPDCSVVHGDVLTASPVRADLALLLKTYHCIEDRQRGAALALVDRLDVGHVAVSFPTRAMNGRAAVFARKHIDDLTDLATRRGWPLSRAALPTEEFVVLHKR